MATEVLEAKVQPDKSGRQQVVSNVLATWVAQGVTIVAGFVMPKMIDVHLGQALLGVWDFAWSLIGYFALVQLGIIGSVNRFVARYQAEGDTDGVNRAVSSVTAVLVLMTAVVVAGLSALVFYILPHFAQNRLGPDATQARMVVLFLGLEVAVQTLFSGVGGVLTGCHRWRLFTALQAGGYGLSVIGMFIALALGRGLATIAFIHFIGIVVVWVTIAWFAYEVCPTLRVRWSLVSKREAREMLGFGSKSFVPQMGDLLLNQTVNILIVGYLGTVALALYSRPRNLVASARTLIVKMSGVLIPSTGSLQALGREHEIRGLAIKATRYAAFMTIPFTCVLVVMGGVILLAWMGPAYSNNFLPGILGLGASLTTIQVPSFCILVGLNRHGPPGRVQFWASIVTAITVWLALSVFKFHILGTAICATAPPTLVSLFYIPVYTARCFGLSTFAYIRESLTRPLIAGVVFSGCLLAARWFLRAEPRLSLLVGCGVGGLVTAPFYWFWAIPPSLKTKMLKMGGRTFGARAVVN